MIWGMKERGRGELYFSIFSYICQDVRLVTPHGLNLDSCIRAIGTSV